MRKGVVAALMFLLACRPDSPPHSAPQHAASIAFREGPGIHDWDFEVHGLPAVDEATGAFVIADVGRGHIVSSLSLDLRWFHPGEETARRTLTVLADAETKHALYDVDGDEEATETAKLVPEVRARTTSANRALAASALVPATACILPSTNGLPICVHPQKVVCGDLAFVLDGDLLSWNTKDGPRKTKLGWAVAPMTIGEGPPKEMVTCLKEAHVAASSSMLAARFERACKGGGSDACFLPEEWRVADLRAHR